MNFVHGSGPCTGGVCASTTAGKTAEAADSGERGRAERESWNPRGGGTEGWAHEEALRPAVLLMERGAVQLPLLSLQACLPAVSWGPPCYGLLCASAAWSLTVS